jgi:hypothetical protein
MSEALKAECFRPHIGQTVPVAGGGDLTLVSLEESGAQAPGALRGFSLILRGPAAPILPEGLHRLTFAEGAGFDLYMMPIHTPSRAHQDYQIAFN